MTEQEYKQKEAKIKERNKNITMKRKLHRMKKSRFKFKKIRTSKKVLWTIIVICLEILFFSARSASTSPLISLFFWSSSITSSTKGNFSSWNLFLMFCFTTSGLFLTNLISNILVLPPWMCFIFDIVIIFWIYHIS